MSGSSLDASSGEILAAAAESGSLPVGTRQNEPMTTDLAPILCMSRTEGSWTVKLKSLSVAQFLDQYEPGPVAAKALEALIGGATLQDYDDELNLTYVTYRPAAVAGQWSRLRAEQCPV